MPWLDLTDVLLDPFLASTFDVYRRLQIMQSNGTPSIKTTARYRDVIGIVAPTGSNSLVRQEAFESQADSIQVITPFRIRAASKDAKNANWQPDLIGYAGNIYLVRTLNDYSKFGGGFMLAECIAINYNPQPAAEFAYGK
jgi:hypothetical protein